MNQLLKALVSATFILIFYYDSCAQHIIESYSPKPDKQLRIGTGENDVLPYIEKGYTLALPEKEIVRGTILLLEGSKFDQKNKSAKLIYEQAHAKGFAVLSVSTEIPLDFYFTNESTAQVHEVIRAAFKEHQLPNANIFLLGIGLSGHRAMKYVKYIQSEMLDFQPQITGVVIVDAALDWVRQYNEGARDVRINYNKGSVWEGSLTTYLLSEHLKGTPKTNLESYLDFSTYSYSDETSRHVKHYKNLALRTYMQVAIQYWLNEKMKTPFDNNGPDMVGLIAEVKLAGNDKSELVIIYPEDSKSEKKNVEGTWISVDKKELMEWVLKQTE